MFLKLAYEKWKETQFCDVNTYNVDEHVSLDWLICVRNYGQPEEKS